MASNVDNTSNNVQHSDPIPISSSRVRARSVSVSSSSSGSASSTFDIPQTSPSSSPILSYFLAQSPTKSPSTATFPFKRKFGTTPVFEDEETDKEIPVAAHARRASATVANRFSQPQTMLPDTHKERGTNLLRRLSLSSAAFKPQFGPKSPPSPPPNTAVSPTARGAPFGTKPRRSATIAESAKPRRAPSPMGERILKGHFDGFN